MLVKFLLYKRTRNKIIHVSKKPFMYFAYQVIPFLDEEYIISFCKQEENISQVNDPVNNIFSLICVMLLNFLLLLT